MSAAIEAKARAYLAAGRVRVVSVTGDTATVLVRGGDLS